MAKRRFSIDAPVTLFFVLAGILIFILNGTVLGKIGLVQNYFTCHPLKDPSGAVSSLVSLFERKNPVSYVPLLTHVLGNDRLGGLLLNSVLLLLLGSRLEGSYGGPMFILMLVLSALVSGVLTVCANSLLLTGADSLIFMMLVLSFFTAFNRGEVQLSWIAAFIIYLVYKIYGFSTVETGGTFAPSALAKESLPVFIDLAGGIAGSLVGFLLAPKKASGGRTSKGGRADDDDTIPAANYRPRKEKSKKQKRDAVEETVVGSLEF